jgi:HTH-type transcriptional regulator / antitoxin HigA
MRPCSGDRTRAAKAGTTEGNRLDVLAILIDATRLSIYPMDPPDPIEAIKFRMEQQGLTRRDLERSSAPRIAEVLKARALDRDDLTTPRTTRYRQKC